MLFNLHHGAVKFDVAGQPVRRDKSPKKAITMRRVKDGHGGTYTADKLGNIDVRVHEHIDTLVSLGYPIYNGDGRTNPVPKDSLIFPNNNLSSPYWQRILEAKNLRRQ